MPQLDIVNRKKEIIAKVTNPTFVKQYAFFPLVHASIKERKYKHLPNSERRAHSYVDDSGNSKSTAKERPLHYSCHMDALIFGYYAERLQEKYERVLANTGSMSDCVIAYRRIPTGVDDKNKSTIHFAKEVFDEIHRRAERECAVLMFDIKSFFSNINHDILKTAWTKLLCIDSLPPDHRNVFNATTRFSYILRDDMRISKTWNGKRKGFDERKLANIRKTGKHSFFANAKEFREAIQNKEIRVCRFPFMKDKKPVGIPQGLAISAVLANLYLLDFDKKVYDYIVQQKGGFYRRYSDDILILCEKADVAEFKEFIKKAITESKVDISEEKTEEYEFERVLVGKQKERITSIKIRAGSRKVGVPLTYLGFEFYGSKTLIKSANLAKFYRRMKRAVKSKAKRAKHLSDLYPDQRYAVYRRQLYKLYTIQDLNVTKVRSSIKRLVKNRRGYYELKVTRIQKPLKSNYLSYVKRASSIMEDDAIKKQIRNHRRIFNETIHKYLQKNKDRS